MEEVDGSDTLTTHPNDPCIYDGIYKVVESPQGVEEK